jgi:hypothetical protein
MTVYRCGAVASGAAGGRPALVSKRWRQLFPRRQFVDVVNVAFARVERLNSPPRGQPFVVAGKPYATDEEFIEDLCEELRQQLAAYLREGREVLT